jgi:hypothetical protein
MPVAVLSGIGWDHEGRTELHYTLTIDEELLGMAPLRDCLSELGGGGDPAPRKRVKGGKG